MVYQKCLIMTEVNQLNNAAPDIAKICNCGAKGEIDCKAKAENSMVTKTNQPVDVWCDHCPLWPNLWVSLNILLSTLSSLPASKSAGPRNGKKPRDARSAQVGVGGRRGRPGVDP